MTFSSFNYPEIHKPLKTGFAIIFVILFVYPCEIEIIRKVEDSHDKDSSRITVKIWDSGNTALNFSTFPFYFS
jgi:hypothetical protein